MGWNEATGADVRKVETAINKFNRSSTFLAVCMILLALMQCFLAVGMLLHKH